MMRFDLNMTSLALPLMLLLCFYGNTQGESHCYNVAAVKENTAWTVFTMETLTINCTIILCGTEAEASWCKIDNLFYCQPVTQTERIQIQWEIYEGDMRKRLYFLHFTNVLVNDTGLYRCVITGNVTSISHSITVSVKAAEKHENYTSNKTKTSGPEQKSIPPEWLPYMYIPLGVLVLIIPVIVTVCLLRCKGSKRSTEAKRSQNQEWMDPQSSVPLNKDEVPQISPCPKLPDPPRSIRSPHTPVPPAQSSCVYDNAPAPAPARRSSRSKRTPAGKAPPPSAGIYDNEREEAEASILYAALNHQVARDGPGPIKEFTEYAAIRVSLHQEPLVSKVLFSQDYAH